jgi:ferritin
MAVSPTLKETYMAMPSELTDALNGQITLEFASAYQYLATAAWLESESFPGMASWMRLQSEEEWAHAMRFFQFVLDRDGTVRLGDIPAPHHVFESAYAAFESALASEQSVTASINNLYGLATRLNDYASLPLLDWFVNEQVEEEATVTQIIDDLERAGTSGHTLLMLDRELGARQAEAG